MHITTGNCGSTLLGCHSCQKKIYIHRYTEWTVYTSHICRHLTRSSVTLFSLFFSGWSDESVQQHFHTVWTHFLKVFSRLDFWQHSCLTVWQKGWEYINGENFLDWWEHKNRVKHHAMLLLHLAHFVPNTQIE